MPVYLFYLSSIQFYEKIPRWILLLSAGANVPVALSQVPGISNFLVCTF